MLLHYTCSIESIRLCTYQTLFTFVQGEVIDMTQKPFDIEYIFNSLYLKKNPVLYVTR